MDKFDTYVLSQTVCACEFFDKNMNKVIVANSARVMQFFEDISPPREPRSDWLSEFYLTESRHYLDLQETWVSKSGAFIMGYCVENINIYLRCLKMSKPSITFLIGT